MRERYPHTVKFFDTTLNRDENGYLTGETEGTEIKGRLEPASHSLVMHEGSKKIEISAMFYCKPNSIIKEGMKTDKGFFVSRVWMYNEHCQVWLT